MGYHMGGGGSDATALPWPIPEYPSLYLAFKKKNLFIEKLADLDNFIS